MRILKTVELAGFAEKNAKRMRILKTVEFAEKHAKRKKEIFVMLIPREKNLHSVIAFPKTSKMFSSFMKQCSLQPFESLPASGTGGF